MLLAAVLVAPTTTDKDSFGKIITIYYLRYSRTLSSSKKLLIRNLKINFNFHFKFQSQAHHVYTKEPPLDRVALSGILKAIVYMGKQIY
jgi:hypothetical protein